jgi:hypothetical protein
MIKTFFIDAICAYTYTGGARGDGAADGGGREGAGDRASCRFAISLYSLQRLYIVNVLGH